MAQNRHQLPWHCQPEERGGWDIISADGEQVALFDEKDDAQFVIDRVNRGWVTAQPWFQAAVTDAIRAGLGTDIN